MFPSSTIQHVIYSSSTHLKLFGEVFSHYFPFVFLYVNNLFFSQFTPRTFFSFWHISETSVLTCMNSIFSSSTPFKVFDIVVLFICIFMVYLFQILRIRQIGQSDETVNRKKLMLSSISSQKSNLLVASSRNIIFQKHSVMCPSSFPIMPNSGITPHFSLLGNRIQSLKSWYIFHKAKAMKSTRFVSRYSSSLTKLIINPLYASCYNYPVT